MNRLQLIVYPEDLDFRACFRVHHKMEVLVLMIMRLRIKTFGRTDGDVTGQFDLSCIQKIERQEKK